jgi:Flp pilus assembly protein TadG
MRRARRQDGQALIEAALVIPLLLLIAVGIFEFGRAYQTWQILTNAAREGARMAVVPYNPGTAGIVNRVQQYMLDGQLPAAAVAAASVTITPTTIAVAGAGGPVNVSASQVTITYPYDFVVLRPIARLMSGNINGPMNIQTSAVMRNEM